MDGVKEAKNGGRGSDPVEPLPVPPALPEHAEDGPGSASHQLVELGDHPRVVERRWLVIRKDEIVDVGWQHLRTETICLCS